MAIGSAPAPGSTVGLSPPWPASATASAELCSAVRALRTATQPSAVWWNVPRRTACPPFHTATSSGALATSTPTLNSACSSVRPLAVSARSHTCQRLTVCGPLTTSYARGRMATAPRSLFVAQTPTGPFCFQARLSPASADPCAVSGREPTIKGRAGESSELRALRPQADYVLTGSAAMIRGRLVQRCSIGA